MPGGILSLSANGTSNAILWANEAFGNLPNDPDANQHSTPNILRAYDVSTVRPALFSRSGTAKRSPTTASATPQIRAAAGGKRQGLSGDLRQPGRRLRLGNPSPTPTRDIRRTVVFIYGQTIPGQDMFVRGGTKGSGPIRIRHRNWLNPHTNTYRLGDANLDWDGVELGQTAPPRQVRRWLAGRLDDEPRPGHGAAICVDGRFRNRRREYLRHELLDA